MKKLIVIALIIFDCFIAASQTTRSALNIPWLSSAQISPDFAGPLTFSDNPAVFPSRTGLGLGMYLEKKFLVEDLNQVVLSGVMFREKSAAGLSLHYFGNPLYNEIKFGIQYGKSLGKVTIGTGISYNILSVRGFKTNSSVDFHISSTWKLSDQFYAGVMVSNPHRPALSNASKASFYRTAFGYQISTNVYSGFEFFKEEDKSLEVVAGIQYQFAETFFARIGFLSGGGMPFFGAGWQFRSMKIELLISHHYALGTSPALLFNYINKEAE